MGAMARLEIPGHPVATGTEPCLVVQEEGRRGGVSDFSEHILPGDGVDLDDVGSPSSAQIADGSRRSSFRDDLDLAGDFAGARVVAAQQGLVSVFGQESAGLNHDPVRAPVDGAGKVVEEEDAHRSGRMWGGGEADQPEERFVRYLGQLGPRGWAVAGEDPVAFVCGNRPPLAGRKVSEFEGADAHAQQSEGGVADGGGHPADLTVLSLDQFEFQPAVGDVLPETDGGIPWWHRWLGIEQTDPARTGAVSLDGDAGGELGEGVGRWDTFDLRPVGAGVPVFGVEESAVETWFVAEEQKTFRVCIKATQGIHPRGQSKAVERAVGGTVRGELAEDAVRLVEGNQHGRGRQTISPRMRRTVTSWVTRVLAIMLSGRIPRQVELG